MVVVAVGKRSLPSAVVRWLMRVSPEYDAEREASLLREADVAVVHAKAQRNRFIRMLNSYQDADGALRRP